MQFQYYKPLNMERIDLIFDLTLLKRSEPTHYQSLISVSVFAFTVFDEKFFIDTQKLQFNTRRHSQKQEKNIGLGAINMLLH